MLITWLSSEFWIVVSKRCRSGFETVATCVAGAIVNRFGRIGVPVEGVSASAGNAVAQTNVLASSRTDRCQIVDDSWPDRMDESRWNILADMVLPLAIAQWIRRGT